MKLIPLNEPLKWKVSCVARLCAWRGKARVASCSQILLVRLFRWGGERPRSVKGFLQHRAVLIIRLLAGVAGVMAPQWLIKRKTKQKQSQKGHRIGLFPTLLLLIFRFGKGFLSKPNWPASPHSLANAHSPRSHFCLIGSK